MVQRKPLRIAFTFERRSDYLALGFRQGQRPEIEDDVAIDEMAEGIRSLGHDVELVGNIKNLVRRLNDQDCGDDGTLQERKAPDWDLVFNFYDGWNGSVPSELQVPALLEAYGIDFVFADSATMAKVQDKGLTKMILEYHGIPTAPYAIVTPSHRTIFTKSNPNGSGTNAATAIAASRHCQALQSYPLFAKPAFESYSIGIGPSSKIKCEADLERTIRDLQTRFPTQDILLETFLVGREFTVGILGTGSRARAIGALELRFGKSKNPEQDYYHWDRKSSQEYWPEYVTYSAEDPSIASVLKVAVSAWRAMGCRDGGRVDVRMDNDGPNAVPHVIEVNALAGLRPGCDLPTLADGAGINYQNLLSQIIESAMIGKAERLRSLN